MIPNIDHETEQEQTTELMDTIFKWVGWIFGIFVVIAFLYVLDNIQ